MKQTFQSFELTPRTYYTLNKVILLKFFSILPSSKPLGHLCHWHLVARWGLFSAADRCCLSIGLSQSHSHSHHMCLCVYLCLSVCVAPDREKNILSQRCHLLSWLSSSANKQYPPVPVAITHVRPFISVQRETEEKEQWEKDSALRSAIHTQTWLKHGMTFH